MVLTIFLQVFLAPTSASYLSHRIQCYTNKPWSFFVVLWIPLFIWINGLPSFPAKQATDWIFMFAIFGIFMSFFNQPNRIMRYVFIAFFALTTLLISTPIFQYGEIGEKFESAIYTITFTILVAVFTLKHPNTRMKNMSIMIASGIGGIVTIMTGSLLIGLIMMSFASFYLIAAIREAFNFSQTSTLDSNNLGLSITLLFISVSRIFAGLSIINTILLCLLLVIPLLKLNKVAQWVINVMLASAILGQTVYLELLQSQNNGYAY